MTLRLYLDDCVYSRELRDVLRAAGHDVETPFETRPSLAGADDRSHLVHAQQSGRILLTFNVNDFAELHEEDRRHSGIFVIYQKNNVRKDMSMADIVAAIANIEKAFDSLEGQLLALNYFQW